MNQTTTPAALDLDKLEALALVPMQATTAIKAEQALADFYDGANPATILALIDLARRAQPSESPSAAGAGSEQMPPLPKPVDEIAADDGFGVIGSQEVYTADQVRAYAGAALSHRAASATASMAELAATIREVIGAAKQAKDWRVADLARGALHQLAAIHTAQQAAPEAPASAQPVAAAPTAGQIMFAAYSRCIVDDRLSPDQIADVLLSAAPAEPIGYITTGDIEYNSDGTAEVGGWDIDWQNKVIDAMPEFAVPETTYAVYLERAPAPAAPVAQTVPIYQVRNGRGVWTDVDSEYYGQFGGKPYERRIVYMTPWATPVAQASDSLKSNPIADQNPPNVANTEVAQATTASASMDAAYNRAKFSRSVSREDFEEGWNEALAQQGVSHDAKDKE